MTSRECVSWLGFNGQMRQREAGAGDADVLGLLDAAWDAQCEATAALSRASTMAKHAPLEGEVHSQHQQQQPRQRQQQHDSWTATVTDAARAAAQLETLQRLRAALPVARRAVLLAASQVRTLTATAARDAAAASTAVQALASQTAALTRELAAARVQLAAAEAQLAAEQDGRRRAAAAVDAERSAWRASQDAQVAAAERSVRDVCAEQQQRDDERHRAQVDELERQLGAREQQQREQQQQHAAEMRELAALLDAALEQRDTATQALRRERGERRTRLAHAVTREQRVRDECAALQATVGVLERVVAERDAALAAASASADAAMRRADADAARANALAAANESLVARVAALDDSLQRARRQRPLPPASASSSSASSSSASTVAAAILDASGGSPDAQVYATTSEAVERRVREAAARVRATLSGTGDAPASSSSLLAERVLHASLRLTSPVSASTAAAGAAGSSSTRSRSSASGSESGTS
jgi:trimeric autotransporter adhesin